jgi:hypothetical protein
MYEHRYLVKIAFLWPNRLDSTSARLAAAAPARVLTKTSRRAGALSSVAAVAERRE